PVTVVPSALVVPVPTVPTTPTVPSSAPPRARVVPLTVWPSASTVPPSGPPTAFPRPETAPPTPSPTPLPVVSSTPPTAPPAPLPPARWGRAAGRRRPATPPRASLRPRWPACASARWAARRTPGRIGGRPGVPGRPAPRGASAHRRRPPCALRGRVRAFR